MGREVTLKVPGLYGHQRIINDAAQRFKLGRWGRRAGKTVWVFRSAVMGHGPIMADGLPLHKGIIHGKDVVWVGRSKDQARTIWNNEVRPRFEATGIGQINDTLFTATLAGSGFGKIIVKSQDKDSISNVRGMGDTVGGVVGDEVAHWDDAEGVFKDILLPVLTDNLGWFAGVSTTEPGSWFNRQCARIMSGDANVATWFHSYATARENPRISKTAFDQLIAEYDANDPRLAKEVFAELTVGGAGHALTIRESDVLIPPLEFGSLRKRNATFFGGVDWGFAHPFSFGLYMSERDGLVTRVDGIQEMRLTPPEQADAVRMLLAQYGLGFRDLDYTVAGGDVFQDKGRSIGMKGVTISEQWGRQGWHVRRGDTRRVAGLSNARTYLYENLFRVAGTRNGMWFISQLQDRVMDERHPEDARKDDARSDGTGGDDGYDECLAPETLVLTRERGWTPVKSLVGTTGVAYSHHGWRPYSDVRRTWLAAHIYRVTLDDGRSVRLTGGHPVLTQSGWVAARDLQPDEQWVELLSPLGYIPCSSTGAENGRDSGVGGSEVPPERARVLAVREKVPASGDVAFTGGGIAGWVADSPQERGQVGQQGRESGVPVPGAARGSSPSGNVGRDACETTDTREEDRAGRCGVSPIGRGAGDALSDRQGDVEASGVPSGDVSSVWGGVPDSCYGEGGVLRGCVSSDSGKSTSATHDRNIVRDMRNDMPVPQSLNPAEDNVLPLVPWRTCRVASVRLEGISDVYNLEVEGANSYVVEGGLVVHNCKIALLSRPRIPSQADDPKLGDDPLREVAWKVHSGELSEPECGLDGVPHYISPITYEDVS